MPVMVVGVVNFGEQIADMKVALDRFLKEGA